MTNSKARYHLLDELRGFAVLCMVFYHAFFTFGSMFGSETGQALLNFFTPFEPYFAFFFIFLSGICCHLSHSNLIRGLKLAAISVAITLVTTFGFHMFSINNSEIYFGILHLLASGMIIYGLIEKTKIKLNPYIMLVVWLLLFFFTYNISSGFVGFKNIWYCNLPNSLYKSDVLAFLGFYSNSFYSADYFPLLPWLFAFFAGAALGGIFKKRGFPKFFKPKRIRFFGFIGRHALLVYILHQPVIYLLALGVDFIMKG